MLITDGSVVWVVRELIVDADHRWYCCVCDEGELIINADHSTVVCATSRTRSTQRAVC